MKPCIIGLTPSDILSSIHKPWMEKFNGALMDAGIVPLSFCFTWDRECLRAQLEQMDGVILNGGRDIDPGRYGEERNGAGESCPERDEFEALVTEEVLRMDKPLLGICRGCQSLNVFAGGSLVQHIPDHNDVYHPVGILGGRLKEIMGAEIIRTNSFHHQAVKRVAPGFIVTARAADGTIEAIEHAEARFAMGIQWHPEKQLMEDGDAFSRKLFHAFADVCRQGARG